MFGRTALRSSARPTRACRSGPARKKDRGGYFLPRLAGLVLAVTLPLVVLLSVQFLRDHDMAEKAAFSNLTARSVSVASTLTNVLGRAEQLLDFLSTRAELRGLDRAQCASLLAGLTGTARVYESVMVLSAQGQLVCSSANGVAQQEFGASQWFKDGLAAPGLRLGDPLVGRIGGKRVAMLSAPLRAASGHTVGLLGVALDLEALATTLPGERPLPMELLGVVKDRRLYLTRTPDPGRWIGVPVSSRVTEKLAGPLLEPVIADAGDGVERAFTATALAKYGLDVVVGEATAPLYASSRQSITLDAVGAFLALAWGLCAASVGSRKLARPLRQIADTTRRIAAGETGVRVDEALPGEVGAVAREFNRLMDQQQQALARLKQSERHANRLNRFYEALSGTNKAIGRLLDAELLFDEVCRICVGSRLAHLAWIGLLEDGRIRPVAWGGRAREYTAGLVPHFPIETGGAGGPISKAVYTGRPHIDNRYLSDAATAPWQARGATFGVKGSAAFPFTTDGVVAGTLNLYVLEEDYFDAELGALLESMMRDISMGLDSYRRESARAAMLELEAANRAKSMFFTRVSHELRTPMNAILGFTQLLRMDAREAMQPAAREQLDNVHLAGTQLGALIDDVLDMSRIDAGVMALHRQDVDLRQLLEGAIKLCQPLADRHAIAVRSAPLTALPARCWTDPVRLRQVILNLVTNGIKYNRRGGHVDVALRCLDGALELTVDDGGLGMSPSQLDTLFQPFNRLGRERTSIEGTGIGMNLTRHLVALFGGSMTVRSDEHIGTRVSVSLPLCDAARPDDAIRSAAHAAEPPGGSPSGTVLYIEDNAVNAILVQQMLASWPAVGFVVAESGEEGLAKALALQPDLVLLDMHLPDMPGIEVLHRLKSSAATAGLRVVVLSASATAEEIAGAVAAGASHYWTKPIDFAEVMGGLRHLLSGESIAA